MFKFNFIKILFKKKWSCVILKKDSWKLEKHDKKVPNLSKKHEFVNKDFKKVIK